MRMSCLLQLQCLMMIFRTAVREARLPKVAIKTAVSGVLRTEYRVAQWSEARVTT